MITLLACLVIVIGNTLIGVFIPQTVIAVALWLTWCMVSGFTVGYCAEDYRQKRIARKARQAFLDYYDRLSR